MDRVVHEESCSIFKLMGIVRYGVTSTNHKYWIPGCCISSKDILNSFIMDLGVYIQVLGGWMM